MNNIESLVSFAHIVCEDGDRSSHDMILCSELVLRAYKRFAERESIIRSQQLISACADLCNCYASEWSRKGDACKAQLSLCHPLPLFALNKEVANAP